MIEFILRGSVSLLGGFFVVIGTVFLIAKTIKESYHNDKTKK